MISQISIDELLRKEEPPVRIEIPVAKHDGETIYTIPADVWETRCVHCAQKNGAENIPVPISAVHKQQYAEIIPCRIMAIAQPNKMPGECMTFAPRFGTYGICDSCVYNSHFAEGFCRKKDHAPQRRVFYGQHYGGDEKNRDYWGRHILSVCDDYTPNEYIKEVKE